MSFIKIERNKLHELAGRVSNSKYIIIFQESQDSIYIQDLEGNYKSELKLQNATNEEIQGYLSVWGYCVYIYKRTIISNYEDLLNFLNEYSLIIDGCGFINETRTEEYSLKRIEEMYDIDLVILKKNKEF